MTPTIEIETIPPVKHDFKEKNANEIYILKHSQETLYRTKMHLACTNFKRENRKECYHPREPHRL